jgi:hypothetical protein
MLCHFAECHYAGCRVLIIVMLNVIMLSDIMLNVVMLGVVAPHEQPHLVLINSRVVLSLFRPYNFNRDSLCFSKHGSSNLKEIL